MKFSWTSQVAVLYTGRNQVINMAKADGVARILAIAALGNSGGGGKGTTNYLDLANKPKINDVELVGNKTLAELGINIPDLSEYYTKEETTTLLDNYPDGSTIVKNVESKIEAVGIKDVKTNDVNKFWTGTRAEYEALTEYSDNTFYAITDDNDDTAMKTEVGAELNGSYANNTLSMSLLNPYGEELSKTDVPISAGVSNYEIVLTKDASGAITADKTMDEIKAAQVAGNIVYASYNNSLMPLVFVSESSLKFTMISDAKSITLSCDSDVWSEITNDLLPLSGGTMTGALTLQGDPVEDNEAANKLYVDSKIVSSQLEHNTLYYATVDGTNDDWFAKPKLQPVLQAAYDGGYHDIMIRTTSGSRFITSSGLDLQSISETTSANLQFVNLQYLTGSTTAPNTIFYGYCYANTVKLDSTGTVIISGTVGKTGGSLKLMKESAFTDIKDYDATKTQVLKNINGTLTWVEESQEGELWH